MAFFISMVKRYIMHAMNTPGNQTEDIRGRDNFWESTSINITNIVNKYDLQTGDLK
jgi:hypothetical protein